MSEKSDYVFSDEEGKYLVKLARRSLTEYLKNNKKIKIPEDAPQKLKMNAGIFVTLHIYSQKDPKLDLRGCIGRPYPEQTLLQAAIDSSIDSGINDWRFAQVSLNELDNILVEVTALTPPEKIEGNTPEDRLNAIEIGKDGLMIELKSAPKGRGGLFLPQVPVEWKWNKQQYLIELCGKAGLPGNFWKKTDRTNLYKFQGEIFTETTPNGEIKRVLL